MSSNPAQKVAGYVDALVAKAQAAMNKATERNMAIISEAGERALREAQVAKDEAARMNAETREMLAEIRTQLSEHAEMFASFDELEAGDGDAEASLALPAPEPAEPEDDERWAKFGADVEELLAARDASAAELATLRALVEALKEKLDATPPAPTGSSAVFSGDDDKLIIDSVADRFELLVRVVALETVVQHGIDSNRVLINGQMIGGHKGAGLKLLQASQQAAPALIEASKGEAA